MKITPKWLAVLMVTLWKRFGVACFKVVVVIAAMPADRLVEGVIALTRVDWVELEGLVAGLWSSCINLVENLFKQVVAFRIEGE